MRRIKLILAYEGTHFSGWQIQKKERTVQGELEKALNQLHKHEVRVTAAGRTDAGVHARGQVCHFDSDASIPEKKYREALNSILPADVRILSSNTVDNRFHARFSAKKRSYRYYIKSKGEMLPWYRNFCLSMRVIPPLSALNSCARQILGTHDFSTFTAAGDKSTSRIREIYSSSFFIEKGYLVYKIEGTAFLWKMVRSIVGTMVETAVLSFPGERMKEILLSGERSMAGTTAPAKGLHFYKVTYE